MPTLEVDVDVAHAQVGSAFTLTVTVRDDDVDDQFTYENVLPDDATFDVDSGVMTWTPQNSNIVTMTLVQNNCIRIILAQCTLYYINNLTATN